MERINPFDRYHYLAQEDHKLPMYEVIPRINKLVDYATQLDRTPIDGMMQRYETAMTQAISLMLSRNIEQDPTVMIANWIRFKDDICTMFKTVLDLGIIGRVTSIPFASSPAAMIGAYIPQYVREFWGVVATIQLMLPIVSATKKRYVEVYNQELSFSCMLSVIDQLMQEMYPQGWQFICDRVYKKAVTLIDGSEDILGEVVLIGLAKLELDPVHYINMSDVENILAMVINGHRAFAPAVLPPTTMY